MPKSILGCGINHCMFDRQPSRSRPAYQLRSSLLNDTCNGLAASKGHLKHHPLEHPALRFSGFSTHLTCRPVKCNSKECSDYCNGTQSRYSWGYSTLWSVRGSAKRTSDSTCWKNGEDSLGHWVAIWTGVCGGEGFNI